MGSGESSSRLSQACLGGLPGGTGCQGPSLVAQVEVAQAMQVPSPSMVSQK